MGGCEDGGAHRVDYRFSLCADGHDDFFPDLRNCSHPPARLALEVPQGGHSLRPIPLAGGLHRPSLGSGAYHLVSGAFGVVLGVGY